MSRITPLAIAWILVASLTSTAQDRPLPDHPGELRLPPARPFAPPPPERRELERGARLLVIENRELPLVDGQLIFRGGSLLEDPDQAGLVELAAEVLREGGSERTSGTELDDWLDNHAASISISRDLDSFRLTFSCLADDLGAVLVAIGELLSIPAYPEEEVEKSKRRFLTRIEHEREDERALADRALMEAVYGADSPLARRPIERTVAALDAEDLRRFHAANLGIDRLIVGVVGAVETDDLASRLEGILGKLPVVGKAPPLPGEVFLQPSRMRILLHDRPGRPQSEIRLAGPSTRRIHRDYSALNLWSQAIGIGGMSNRLMVRLRTERGLVYSGGVFFRPDWGRSGLLYGFCRTRNETALEATQLMLGVLREGLGELPEEELSNARRQLLNAEVFAVDRPEKVLARALELELHGYPPELWELHSDRLRTLTSGEVAEAISRHLDVDRLVVVVVGPADELEAPLAELGEVIRIDPLPAGEPLVDRILEGLGGREAWSGLRFLESELEYDRSGGPGVKLHVWQDLSGPRMRVEQELGATRSVLVVNEEGAWMRAGDSVLEMTPEKHAELVATAERDVFRILVELASAEVCPLERSDAVRLVVVEGAAEGTWLELDETGHLSRLGYERGEDEVVLGFSGWRDFDGVFSPTRIEKLPDVWTRRVQSVRAHAELDAALFERP